MIDYKTEYKRLIEIVREKREKNNIPTRNEDFASMLGYNRSYFSTLLGEKGKVTAEHIKVLVFHFDWLKKQMDPKMLAAISNVGKYDIDVEEDNNDNSQNHGQDTRPSKQSLEKSIENLTQNELRTTAIIERLVTLLEKQYGGVGPQLAPPGTEGTETLNPRKQKKPV